ncbi:hypothetical protein U27_02798 [Candidatus Vecturithrix granuli]|uniref:Uncharacterized protein n=1 Tax=Vecturithrix granuli TaxID=1499967 RepID=A0A081BU32_VECG1|nr:hypothetical protein U27_02798 [Candidatus Vecturithrix granuli]
MKKFQNHTSADDRGKEETPQTEIFDVFLCHNSQDKPVVK